MPRLDARPSASIDQHFEASFWIDPEEQYLLQNRTPYRIKMVHADASFGEMHLPPLAERVVAGARLAPFEGLLRAHRQRHEIRVRLHLADSWGTRLAGKLMTLAIIVLLAVIVYDTFAFGTLLRIEFTVAILGASLVVAGCLAWGRFVHERRRRDSRFADSVEGNTSYSSAATQSETDEMTRSASHIFTLVIVVAIGAILPAIAIIAGTPTREFATFEGGLRVLPGFESRFVARSIQVLYVAILSLFPALLFFQFDRQRVGKIRFEWVRSIFRLDARMRTLADVDAWYGHDLAEGSNYSDDSNRLLGFKHSPIVVATMLIALGWTVLVMRTEAYDFEAVTTVAQQVERADEAQRRAEDAATAEATGSDDQQGNEAAVDQAASDAEQARDVATAAIDAPPNERPASNEPRNTEDISDGVERATAAAEATRDVQLQVQSTKFFQLLTITPGAAGMAFLGAYFYGMFLALRSYFRNDLLPKLYHQISARLVTVVVIAYLLNALLYRESDRNVLWLLAFLAGIIPTTVLQRVLSSLAAWGSATKRLQPLARHAFARSRPLTQIDGIDLYDSGRLEAEGLTNVPALASGNLVSVMVRTRMPIEQLIDWVDQSVLMVVLSSGDDEELDDRVARLRHRGIRTATDFVRSCSTRPMEHPALVACLDDVTDARGDAAADARPDPQRTANAAGDVPPAVTPCEVCDAIGHQPAMAMITQWRNSPLDDVGTSAPLLPPFDEDSRDGECGCTIVSSPPQITPISAT